MVGLGSIGNRHIRVLENMIPVKIDCYRSGKGTAHKMSSGQPEIEHSHNMDECIGKKPDFGIIANPTVFHLETALKFAHAGIPFLIEKPVSDRYEGLQSLQKIVLEREIPVLVGFQMRYHPGFRRLSAIIDSGEIGRPLSLQGYVGQYLPDWQPKEDYRKKYSARKDLGGGVILDLCHEIDIAMAIMGEVVRVSCICDHYSDLEIETEDMADISMEHKNRGISHIHLNYLERGYEWVTRVMGTNGTATWDCGRGYVEIVRSDGTSERWNDPHGFERDWLFRDQLINWLKVLDGKDTPEIDLVDGINVTRVALAAKRSSEQSRHIEL